jgi:hypothetical protein
MNLRIGIILILALFIELVYLLFDNTSVHWFPVANLIQGVDFTVPNLTLEYIMYYTGQHLALCFLAFVIWKETGSVIGKYFFILKSIDLVDYLVTYNHVYFRFDFSLTPNAVFNIPVSFNVISCLVFVVLTLRIWIKELSKQL